MYIGKTPTVGNFQVCDAISVVNGQAAYTLQVGGTNVAPESANHMLVSLNGILQKPGSSFTISGSTMTFASNLATGDVIDFVQILGNVLDLGQPSDDTVTAAKLNNNIISGQTALTDPPADTDELLISDAGTLKRIDVSLIGGLAKVSSASGTGLSSQASIEIALPETYRAFKMYLDIKPETDNAHLQATLSVDDGSSYYGSANNYQYGYQHIYQNDTAHDVIYSNGDTKIELTKDGGSNTANAEGHHLMFDIKPINTESSVNQHNHLTWEGSRNDGSNAFRTIRGSGVLAATYTNKINKIKIAYDSGNIEDYFVTLYGYLA